MKLTRLRVCAEADQRLIHLKARTGLNPNILCRIGFCLSLNDPSIPNPSAYPPDSPREINRYTLLGEWDDYFVALLREYRLLLLFGLRWLLLSIIVGALAGTASAGFLVALDYVTKKTPFLENDFS